MWTPATLSQWILSKSVIYHHIKYQYKSNLLSQLSLVSYGVLSHSRAAIPSVPLCPIHTLAHLRSIPWLISNVHSALGSQPLPPLWMCISAVCLFFYYLLSFSCCLVDLSVCLQSIETPSIKPHWVSNNIHKNLHIQSKSYIQLVKLSANSRSRITNTMYKRAKQKMRNLGAEQALLRVRLNWTKFSIYKLIH